MSKCILIKLPDSREFFTHEKNHQQLLEFSETFNSKILTIETDNPNLLPLKGIVKAFCDQNINDSCPYTYRIIDSCQNLNTRDIILKKVYDIRTYIESRFLEGGVISIKELHDYFKNHNIAVSTLYRHLANVKTKLKAQNRKIIKISAGRYKLV